ncbi:hypothetical protein ACP26L_12755 [Paenibacillus sp. S-38]|uniref:hypothetical protein n=1 Tax=Paenibacillus sp. S-38 TaxID=3416710 RepID=UPI003CE70232
MKYAPKSALGQGMLFAAVTILVVSIAGGIALYLLFFRPADDFAYHDTYFAVGHIPVVTAGLLLVLSFMVLTGLFCAVK